MIVSLVQHDVKRGEVEATLGRVEAMLGAGESDLYVLPELFATGYFFSSPDEAHSLAESVPNGPTVHRLERWARETGATFVAGVAERDDSRREPRFFNSAVVVTPRGWLGTYRKTHLFYEEGLHFAPGDSGFQVWTVTDRRGAAYRLGVMVCFDWFFPEAARTLALAGAQLIAHPSNLVLPHCPDSMPVRALENGVYTATANRVGTESSGREELTFIGRSVICSPRRVTLVEAPPDREAVVSAEIDWTLARSRVNTVNDRWTDRRPALYG